MEMHCPHCERDVRAIFNAGAWVCSECARVMVGADTAPSVVTLTGKVNTLALALEYARAGYAQRYQIAEILGDVDARLQAVKGTVEAYGALQDYGELRDAVQMLKAVVYASFAREMRMHEQARMLDCTRLIAGAEYAARDCGRVIRAAVPEDATPEDKYLAFATDDSLGVIRSHLSAIREYWCTVSAGA